MLPLQRLHHPLGHHYPGVKLHTAVNPWVIQCAVIACVQCAVVAVTLSAEGKTLFVQFISPLLFLLLPPLPYLHSPLPLFSLHSSASSSPHLSSTFFCCLTSPIYSLSLLLYHSPYRGTLEEFFYSDLASVNDEEPPTFHSLIFNLQTRVDIYMYLLKYLI